MNKEWRRGKLNIREPYGLTQVSEVNGFPAQGKKTTAMCTILHTGAVK